MFEKLRDKALKVNLKKGFIGLVIAGVVFAAGSGVLLYQNFGDRVAQTKDAYEQQWEQMVQDYEAYTPDEQNAAVEQDTPTLDDRYSDYYGQGKHFDGWNCWEHGTGYGYADKGVLAQRWDVNSSQFDLESEWNLTTGDKVLVGAVMGIAAVLGMIYWLLCMAWAYQTSNKLGSNSALWVIATLFFNLWAIAGLYIYAGFKGKCEKCGHLKQKGEKYCSHCGNAYEIMCESCQTTVSADAAYCPNCGKPVNKEKAENK